MIAMPRASVPQAVPAFEFSHATLGRLPRVRIMELTLVISGLLDIAVSALADADAGAPALARLVDAAQSPAIDRDSNVAIACSALGIARQRDWPVAAFLARAAGIDPGAGYWLCAEPATFVVGQADVRLSGLVRDLGEPESSALLATLNAHFASDGVCFVALEASRWLVGADAEQALVTHPPDAVLGAPLLALLPTGADAPRWRRWQSEMQMMLFEHPVNRARESAGRAPVNGVWLWGGGTPVAGSPPARIATLHTDAWLPRELARGAGVASASVPPSFDALRGKDAVSPVLVWLDAPDAGEAERLAKWLAAVDRDWVRPAANALNAGQISRLDLALSGRATTLRFSTQRLSFARRLRNWRAAPRLSALLATALER